jgi:MinD superfamily P-loop ATPase
MIEEYLFLSGKGGSGKTTVCAAWAHLTGEEGKGPPPVLVDADVDAANLGLLTDPMIREEHPFEGPGRAIVDEALCDTCGLCAQLCRFDALRLERVDPVSPPVLQLREHRCEGCGVCVEACPPQAIRLEPRIAGCWYRSETRRGPLFHARLKPGAEHSGKLVTAIRRGAREWAEKNGYPLLLVDGPPGIGCPVISAVSGVSGVVAIAEASKSGCSDLERVLALTARFRVPVWVCLNKADLDPAASIAIERLCSEGKVEIIGRIPYDSAVMRTMATGDPVTFDSDSEAGGAIRRIWKTWQERYRPLRRLNLLDPA